MEEQQTVAKSDELVMPEATETQSLAEQTQSTSASHNQAEMTDKTATDNPLDSYFSHGEKAPEAGAQADSASGQPQSQQTVANPNPLPETTENTPKTLPPNPDEVAIKPAPKPADPAMLALKKAKRKQIIKWIVVIINFALTGFLLYYYFYMSKK